MNPHAKLLISLTVGAVALSAPLCRADGIAPPPRVGSTSADIERLPSCEPSTAPPPFVGAAQRSAPAVIGPVARRNDNFVTAPDSPRSAETLPAPRSGNQQFDRRHRYGACANPNLIAQRQAEPTSRAVLGVAQAYPFNPFAQLQAFPYSRNRYGAATPVYNYALFMQTFELAHQSAYREAAGMADLARVQWTIRQAELTNVALTERMFFTVLYQRGVRDLAVSLAKLNDEPRQRPRSPVSGRRGHGKRRGAGRVASSRLAAAGQFGHRHLQHGRSSICAPSLVWRRAKRSSPLEI